MTAHNGHKFGSVGRTALAEPVRLDVLVQQFIGVQLRAVAGHPNQLQPRLVFVCKARGCSGFMHGMPIHDQIDCAGDLFEQPLQERHKDGGLEVALKHHEGEGSLVGDGRDHVTPEALAGSLHDWGSSDRSIARPRHMVTAQPHFVAPINDGVRPLGLPGKCWVFPL